MKRMIGTGLLVAAAAFAAGAAWAQDTVKVGVIFPLSGGAGPQGQHIAESLDAMATMINDKGGVMGRKIELHVRDDESTPAVGVSRANELIGEGVEVIIEGWNSPVTLAMQPVIARAGILDITAISKADPILSGEGNPLAIRFNSSNALDGAVIAKYIVDQGATRIAFLTENDAYGNGAQASIEAALNASGHAYEIVAVEKFPFDQADFRVPLSTVKAADPEITIAINANEGLGMPALIRQASRSRLPGTLVSAVGTVAPSVIEVAGEAANGVVGADIYFPQVEPFASNPVNQAYVAKMQEMHDRTPDKFMALAAAALQVWAMAVEEVQSFEKEAVANRIRGGSFTGTLLGDVTFQPNGQLDSNHYLFTVVDQKMVVEQ
ncbi:ABC transporter substrate-binding protein [Albimonas pacifica]|uniref:Amino acid/amide ABC transporter substrate-binding protein, HAAT family n=1 Tax=Albimonas pacifica TaxID=1114924 RepID=A0A1I3BEY8_9RHOB|nr:ABC transporter substrate-binding protein [Albimonas pacifica]SFH60838.1 amino acid/amide ABC transporter substrate-binding protein, HAAT family [Albimonas pacifica]